MERPLALSSPEFKSKECPVETLELVRNPCLFAVRSACRRACFKVIPATAKSLLRSNTLLTS